MINRNLFTQVNQDSGSLTSATTVVHRFAQLGGYKGVVVDGRGATVGEFSIRVGEGKGKMEGHEASLPTSVQIDLASLMGSSESAGGTSSDDDCGCCDDEGQSSLITVAAEGYAVFKVSTGGGYAVELYKSAEAGKGEKVFDSRALGRRDTLAVVLLRPGSYSVTNASNGTKADLRVAYPDKAIGILDPVKVVCAAEGINPSSIKVKPTQGLLFNFETPSRVKIELVAPEDRPRPVVPAAAPKVAARGTAPRHSRRMQLYPRRQVRRG